MSQANSPSAERPYGLERVLRCWPVQRSGFYARRKRAADGHVPAKRGPKPACDDAALLAAIQRVLADSPWVGEGYRKVWARLRAQDTRTSPKRVLRVMREHDLLAPTRAGRARGPQAHDGTIIPPAPDQRWGTDQSGTLTGEGQAAIFFVLDHFTGECLGIHAARRGTRWEALEPLRQAAVRIFGHTQAGVATAAELELRHDHGSQFVSRDYQRELRHLGITSSPSFVRQPEGNGCAERFVRTLKEQLLWLQHFATVEELRQALRAFQERYNQEWILGRHGYRTPAQVRAQWEADQAAADAA